MGFPTYSAARLEQAGHTAEIALVHAALHPHPSVLLEVLAAVADVHYLGHFDQRNLRHVQRQPWRRPPRECVHQLGAGTQQLTA